MHAVGEQTRQPCPECGAEIRTDRRFTTWCAVCDWNVDPQRPDEPARGLKSMRRKVAQRYGERLFGELSSTDAPEPTGRTAVGLAASAVALAVHGLTAALAAAGIGLLASGWGGPSVLLGLVLLALAWSLRPRLNRLPKDARVLLRHDAPELYALIDEIAAAMGTRGVDAVVVDDEPNASVTHLGVRRRMLTLGLPLWEVLTPQQRVALLGHELGHFTHGDTRRGMVVGTAYRSLSTWYYYVSPIRHPKPLEVIANLFYILPRTLITGVVALLDLLTARASQRGEYLADTAAARAGSTEAATGLMDRLLAADSITTVLTREANSRRIRGRSRISESDADGLWETLAAHMDSIPESERERLRRVGALRGHSVDASHPPTHLRLRLLLDSKPADASVTLGADRSERIAGELADARRAVAKEIVRDGFVHL
ncbi:M48 family metallopeptidase [Streptomyces sp. NPDC047072]|uniref:M48 family metallopeptidase n=1 Tax=Streptomyces sp. NPDC047072 TaxID=3154809 RepID=UPI0033C166F4